MDLIGSKLQQAYPELDVVSEFGVMLHRWLDEELIRL